MAAKTKTKPRSREAKGGDTATWGSAHQEGEASASRSLVVDEDKPCTGVSDCEYTPTEVAPGDVPESPFFDDDDALSNFENDSDSGNSNHESGDDGDGDAVLNEWVKAAGQWLDLAEAEAFFGEDEGEGDGVDVPQPPAFPGHVAAKDVGPNDLDLDNVQKSLDLAFESAVDFPQLSNPTTAAPGHPSSGPSSQEGPNHGPNNEGASPSSNSSSSSSSSLSLSSDLSSDLSLSPDLPLDKAESGVKDATAKTRVAKIEDDRFDFPPYGSVRYNYRQRNLVAHCSCHSGNCRRTRTVNPPTGRGRTKGQGRPIGLLVAWLQKAEDHTSDKNHSSQCRPSLHERHTARETFYDLGGKEWAQTYEREKEDNEPSELEDIT